MREVVGRSRAVQHLLEALEPRQLMMGLPVLSPFVPLVHVVLEDASNVLLATLPGKHVTIPEDTTTHGPAVTAMVDWGDGTMSPAILHRVGSKIQVWGGHAYDTLKTYRISILTETSDTLKLAARAKAKVELNAKRGKTLTVAAGEEFSGAVCAVDRTAGLPRLNTAASSITLPAGSKFAQYTVGDAGGVATFHVDWGDGSVSEATLISQDSGKYKVLGEHAYSAAGSYRVVTYAVINASDNTLLHVDVINSTAHVQAAGERLRSFALPGHAQVSWSDVLPAGTMLDTSSSSGTNMTGGAEGAIVSSGINAGILTIGGGHFSGSGAGSLTLANGNVILNGTSSGSLVFVKNNAGNTAVLSGTASGTLTLVHIGQVLSGAATGGGLTINTGMGTLSLGSGSLTAGETGGGVLNGSLTNGAFVLQIPLLNNTTSGESPSGTITGGGTLVISGGWLSMIHVNPGATLVLPPAVLAAQWTVHADGTTWIDQSTTLRFDGSSAGALFPQRHSGPLTYMSDVPLTVVESTLAFVPLDFSGTITLPAGTDPAALGPLAALRGATVVVGS